MHPARNGSSRRQGFRRLSLAAEASAAFGAVEEETTSRGVSDSLRIGFAGTPDFAARALAAIVDAGHDVALVLTQPDRPSGRGLRRTPGAVKAYAHGRGLRLLQPPG